MVHYAPHHALLRRATLVINAAGLNTSLDAIRQGIPIIAVPIAEDQPGVAARLRRANVAVVIPYRRLSIRTVQAAIDAITTNPIYGSAARTCQAAIARQDGVQEGVHLHHALPGTAANGQWLGQRLRMQF